MPNYSGLFRVDDSFTLSLISAFLEENGTEALEWEPETIRREIEADFGVEPSQVVLDKIQAAIVILTTDQEYAYWEPFEEIVHTLNDTEANFEIMRPPTPEELAWAVVESHAIDPPEAPLETLYSGEVQAYIATILKTAGFYKAPEALQFVDMDRWVKDPEVEHKDLKGEISDIHAVKMLRVRTYITDRYDKLSNEIRQYFSKKLPPLTHLLEQVIVWR